jgi:hypothetical protein
MSTTNDSLHLTQVLAEPLFVRRSSRPAAQLVSHLPRGVVLAFPHCVEGNVYRHHRYSGPLDRDVAVDAVEQNTWGAQCWRPPNGRQSV